MRNSHIESIIIFLSIPASSSPDSASKSYWFVLLTAQKKMWELYSCSSHKWRLLHALNSWTSMHRTHTDMNILPAWKCKDACINISYGHLPSLCSWLFRIVCKISTCQELRVKVNAFYYVVTLFCGGSVPLTVQRVISKSRLQIYKVFPFLANKSSKKW